MTRLLVLITMVVVFSGSADAQVDRPDRASGAKPPGTAAIDSEDGFLPLFDGKLLTNWEGKGYWFRVEDKAIVAGRLDQRIPNNLFLCTTRTFGDFELRLQVKVVGEGVNAGIQFRSQRIPGSDEVLGYQADVGGVRERSVWGALYDESRRKRMLAEPDPERIAQIVRPDDWNDYVIRCVGPKIELYLNGEQTVDYTEQEPGIATEGVIALQIHSGPASEAWYRDLRIKPL